MITDDVALPSLSLESVHSCGCTVSCPWAGVYNLSEPQFPPGAPPLRSSCRMGGSPHRLILGALGRDRCSDSFLTDTFPPPCVCCLEEEPGAAWLWSLWGWEATASGRLQGCLASLWETGSVLIWSWGSPLHLWTSTPRGALEMKWNSVLGNGAGDWAGLRLEQRRAMGPWWGRGCRKEADAGRGLGCGPGLVTGVHWDPLPSSWTPTLPCRDSHHPGRGWPSSSRQGPAPGGTRRGRGQRPQSRTCPRPLHRPAWWSCSSGGSWARSSARWHGGCRYEVGWGDEWGHTTALLQASLPSASWKRLLGGHQAPTKLGSCAVLRVQLSSTCWDTPGDSRARPLQGAHCLWDSPGWDHAVPSQFCLLTLPIPASSPAPVSLFPLTQTWMDPETIIQSDVSQRSKYLVSRHTCRL